MSPRREVVEGGAGRVSVVKAGSWTGGTPVVLIHGINGAANDWSGVIEHLAARPVLAVDLRGHGESSPVSGHRPGDYGAQAYAADVAAVVDHLAVTEAHLVGASFGGGVAITLAARRPGLARSVTVVGGALSVTGRTDVDALIGELHRLGAAAFFELVASASFAPGTDEALLSATARVAARSDVDTVEAILRDALSDDVSAAAAEIGTETGAETGVAALTLTGEYDQTCPPDLGAALAQALRCRHSVMAGRGHMAHLEAPAAMASLLDEHLADVEARRSRIGG